ncbi:MAG TPA: AI-2E family transporter [Chloroflexota bacterium]|nr:AI-2E family transporter [Chloroflexota bacterium]
MSIVERNRRIVTRRRRQGRAHREMPDLSFAMPSHRVTARVNLDRAIVIAPRTIWLTAGIALGLVLGWVVIAKALDVVVMMLSGIILAEGIRPLVDRLASRHVPRSLAVLLLYLAFIGIAALIVWALIPPLSEQTAVLSNNFPGYLVEVQKWLGHLRSLVASNAQLERVLNDLPQEAAAALQQIVPALLAGPIVVVNLVSNAIIVLLLAFFWLTTARGLKSFVVEFFPPSARDTVSDVLGEMGYRVGGYLRGVVINMIVIGLLSGIGILILGGPYPLVLGLIAGLTEAIPIIGPFIGGGFAVLVSLIAVSPIKAGEVALLYLLIQQIEGNTLVPLVMNRVVNLNPLVVVLSILVGSALLGIVGALLAVPTATVIQILILRVFAPAIRRSYARRAHEPVA